MQALIDQFLDYLSLERGLSEHTRMAYASDLQALKFFLGKHGFHTLNHVTRKDLMAFLMEEKERGLAPSSLARRLVCLKVFFRYLNAESLLAQDITETMEGPHLWQVLPHVLSVTEVEQLLRAPNTDTPLGLRDKAMLETLYGTGLRVSELTGLKIDDLHFDEDYIRCFGKGRKERVVPIGQSACDWINRYRDEVRPAYLPYPNERILFLSRGKRPMNRTVIWRMIRKCALTAGINKPVSPHTLRHSFASHMLANQAPLRLIQEMLGHADIATTQIYTHIDQGRLAAVHRQFHPRA